MRKVILQFQCILDMVDFQSLTDTFSCESNLDQLTLVCSLSEAEIELAQNGYHARLLQTISA